MKKTVFLLAISLALSGCVASGGGQAPPESGESPISSAASAVLTKEPAPEAALVEEAPFRPEALDRAAFLEDYDAFWQTVDENYPLYRVAVRLGCDLDALRSAGRAKISDEITLPEFAQIMKETADGFGAAGHMQFLASGEAYAAYLETYAEGSGGHMDYLARVLRQPKTAACYAYLTPGPAAQPEREEGPDGAGAPAAGNATAQILEEGRIAYVKLPSFGWEFTGPDGETLLPFFQSVEQYPHIILDIRGNGGGSDSYWNENIVFPLLSKPVSFQIPLLYRDTEPVRAYLEADGLLGQCVPLSELKEPLPALPPEDRAELTHALLMRSEITAEQLHSSFQGKIWLLVDGAVYSSAESLAMSCKRTGFATIVGTNTGGDGGGLDPMIFSLPNTGLLWRNSILYSVNPDGSNNEEVGTTPDIPVPPGQDALDVCLAEIAKGAPEPDAG